MRFSAYSHSFLLAFQSTRFEGIVKLLVCSFDILYENSYLLDLVSLFPISNSNLSSRWGNNVNYLQNIWESYTELF